MKRKRLIALVAACALLVALLPAAMGANTRSEYSTAAAGMAHTLASKADGTVWAWGSNKNDQLGDTGTLEEKSPVEVKGISAVLSVAAGYDFSVALRYDGFVYTWGFGKQKTPTMVRELSGIVAIAAGKASVLALKGDGTVWQWMYGSAPTKVPELSRVAAISAGGGHYLALTFLGEVWAWGSNESGQLGDGGTVATSVPVKVKNLTNIVDIAAGYSHSLAAAYDGTLYAWGSNGYGQLGKEDAGNQPLPAPVEGITAVARVSAGNGSSMALNQQGKVYTWGYGEYGQLGYGDGTIAQITPKALSTPSDKTVFIASGVYHNLCTTSGGALYAWGRNQDYQVDNEKHTAANTPQRVFDRDWTGGNIGYVLDGTAGMDGWAKQESKPLYAAQLVSPLLWGNFKNNITRAEFAHMLVCVYEQVKDTTASVGSSSNFTDIEGNPLEKDLRKANLLGIISGTGGGTLAAPNNLITRQEAAKMLCSFLVKMEGVKISDKLQNLGFYWDAPAVAEWAAPYVFYANQNGIMQGDSSGYFHPTSPITRQESLVVVSRLMEKYNWK